MTVSVPVRGNGRETSISINSMQAFLEDVSVPVRGNGRETYIC